MLRFIVRAFLSVLILVIITLIALYLGRYRLAELAIIQQLEQRGFENVALKVDRLAQDGVTLTGLQAGPNAASPALSIRRLDVATNLQNLRMGEIGALTLSGVAVDIRQTDRDWLIGGAPLSRLRGARASQGGQPSVALSKVILDNVTANIVTQGGEAQFLIDGSYDLASGGTLMGRMISQQLTYPDVTASNIETLLELSLSQNGAFRGSLDLTSDISIQQTTYPRLTLSTDFEGPAWQSFLIDPASASVNAEIDLKIPALPLTRIERLQPTMNFFVAGPIAQTAGVEIISSLTYQNGELQLMPGRNAEAAFAKLTLDNGFSAILTDIPGKAILTNDRSGARADFAYAVEGIKAAPATGIVSLVQEDDAPLKIRASMKASRWKDTLFELVPGQIAFDGTMAGPRLAGRVTFQGGASFINTDNSVLRNFLTNGVFYVTTNFADRSLKITTPDGCIDLATPTITTKAGNFQLQNASFCAPALAPIILDATRRPGEGIQARAKGVLRAGSFRADIGETRLTGRPPIADINVSYGNDRLNAAVNLTGSDLNFDDRLSFSNARAIGTATYENGDISFEGDVSDLLISDLTTPVIFTPLSFTGRLNFQDSASTFSGELATPEGDPLAGADGKYELRTGKGTAQLNFGPLTFAPGGLQPGAIAPPLKGYLENTIGQAGGIILLDWANNSVATSGTFDITDLTFNGPVRQVTLTDELTTKVVFSKLRPLKTDGVQEARVKLIDLDSLILTDGIAQYEFPGDDTIRIRSAKWPWFSGELEIIDARIPLDRSKVTVPLQIRDINLAELLNYFNVDGLSGSGRLEGTLPVIFEDGKARIENGRLASVGVGTLKYESDSVDAAARAAGDAGRIAFDALTDYRFTDLELTINGDLSGDVDFNLKMNGRTDSEIASRGLIYNINIKAPLFGLIEQFRANQRGEDYLLEELSRKAGVELIFDTPEVTADKQ